MWLLFVLLCLECCLCFCALLLILSMSFWEVRILRAKAPSKKDKKFFRRTAAKVKKVNLPGRIYRGGFRF